MEALTNFPCRRSPEHARRTQFSELVSPLIGLSYLPRLYIYDPHSLDRSSISSMNEEEKQYGSKDASFTNVVEGEKGDAVFGEYKEGDVNYKSAGW